MFLKNTVISGYRLEDNHVPQICRDVVVSVHGQCNGKKNTVRMSREILAMHSVLIGATGSGKTNLLKQILPQLISTLSSSDVMLVFDSKMDFVDLHREKDLVVSNCHKGNEWNIFMDVVSDGWDITSIEENADEIAELLFADAISNSNQPFFPRAARDIFSAIVQAMCRIGANNKKYRVEWMNNMVLKRYISQIDAVKLKEFLKEYPDLSGVLKYVGNGCSDQSLGVFAELQSVVNNIFVGSFNQNGRLSIRHVVKERQARVLYVEYDPSNGASIKPTYQTLVDLFLKEALSTRNIRRGNVYVICDELKMLPRLHYFEDALNFGRSLGISVICGIQSMQQLYETYGEFGGKNIAAGFQSVFCFCTHDEETRNYIQSLYGKNMCLMQYSTPSGNIKEERVTGYCIEEWDMVSLKRGEAIIGLPFEKPFRFLFDRYGG